MANITINEVSQNYTYNIGNSSYATVALPITACWGPGWVDNNATGLTLEESLEQTVWNHFPANQEGLESFVATYRGSIANYRLIQDYSYYVAMSLLTSGYDILVCRLAAGVQAQGEFTINQKKFTVKAKYCGSFGNKLRVVLQKLDTFNRWNLVTYVIDDSGVQNAVENINFVFEIENSTDTLLQIDEIESNFLEFTVDPGIKDADTFETTSIRLTDGSDSLVTEKETVSDIIDETLTKYTNPRYEDAVGDSYASCKYITALTGLKESLQDVTKAKTIEFKEWTYSAAYNVLGMLDDKLAYNPNRVIVPGWDDQDICYLNGDTKTQELDVISPLHSKLLDVAYYSRCATAYIDVPKSLSREYVYNDSDSTPGYAQKLARIQNESIQYDANIGYYTSHSALFAPWGRYIYTGTAKQNVASPSFLALMIDRAMILNQPSQYEWQLPTSRSHNLNIGKLDYDISKKYLDMWQSNEGVGVNCITNIPEMGVSIWGNSTLIEVPPATYQALANLSTRKLVNAVENLAYKCGIAITFNYNNDQAYNSFYAGMTPLLDTMKNVGAIEDYYIRMADDINGLDSVNANSVIGKIYLSINGVINDINIDLLALPSSVSLDQYRA